MTTLNLWIFLTFFTSTLAAVTNQEIEFISQFVKPGDLVFDVGANIGKKAEIYLACKAHIICVEPQPDCCNVLRNKFMTCPVTIVEKALSYEPGELELAICSVSNAISTLSSEWQHKSRFTNHYRWDRKISVQVTTLDDLIAQYGLPQFCKIDVENYEYEVLKGLSQPIPYLSFEFAAETLHNTIKCLNYLETLGYRSFNVGLGEEPRLQYSTWLDSKTLLNELNKLITHDIKLWGDIYAKI